MYFALLHARGALLGRAETTCPEYRLKFGDALKLRK
jgi:hypothetical protein